MTPREFTDKIVALAISDSDAEVLAVVKALQDACGALLDELAHREHARQDPHCSCADCLLDAENAQNP
jgi:hypothetical protein